MENIMEKVEALRTKANITYEEAKAVLDETNGDMLDAIILLEKRGKIKRPETEVILRSNTDDEKETTNNNDTDKGGRKVKSTVSKIINVLKNNSFIISRKGEELFKMPLIIFVILLFFTWHVSVPALIIALFFDVRYAFTGKDDLSSANEFMEKAGAMADEMKTA